MDLCIVTVLCWLARKYR